MSSKNLLVELFVEELPPKALKKLGESFSTVLADTEDVWGELFKAQGGAYQQPKLVLFRGATPTACGTGQSAMGPFYCPGDQKVYIDLSFYDTLRRQLGAPLFERTGRGLLRDEGYSANEVEAVLALRPQEIAKVPQQLAAVREFMLLPESESLAAANKRIGNILKKSEDAPVALNAALLQEAAEQQLADAEQ